MGTFTINSFTFIPTLTYESYVILRHAPYDLVKMLVRLVRALY